MISQNNSIVISVCTLACAARFRANAGPKSVGMIGRPHAQPLLRRNNAYRAVAVSLPSAKSGNIRPWQKLRSAGARRPSCSRKMRHGGSRRILPSCRSCCAKRESMQHRLCVGFVKKGDQGRKAGAAFRAVPNVTRVVVAPILRPYGRNQLSIALNATQHVTLPTNTRR